MTRNVRKPLTAILALLGLLISSSIVLAEDYSVDFGIRTDIRSETGTLTCRFDEICALQAESPNLRVTIYVSRRHHERGSVGLYSDDLTCCFFNYAADRVAVYTRQPMSDVAFFKGARARGELFVENKRAGTLYLKFNLFRDRI